MTWPLCALRLSRGRHRPASGFADPKRLGGRVSRGGAA
jgi:hypothetical protein